MSQCTFIAADVPLEEIRDRYTRPLSLREAVKAGAGEPGVVISCVLRPGEDPADNFSLLEFPFARRCCGMDCAVSIEMGFTKTNGSGDMTPEKAERIADYVREVLTRTDGITIDTFYLTGVSGGVSNNMRIREMFSRKVAAAFVALEDRRFYDHKGYDVRAMGRALVANIKSRSVVEGASTITQQLVKNTHLDSGRTVKRKPRVVIHSAVDPDISAYPRNLLYTADGIKRHTRICNDTSARFKKQYGQLY